MQRSVGLILVTAGLMLQHGCGPSGVGSVDWADDSKTKSIGAPPPRTQPAPARSKRPGTPKQSGEFLPG